MIDKQRFNVREAGEYLGVAAQTLNRWRMNPNDGPPFVKLGRRVVYERADLDAWLAANRRKSTIEAREAGQSKGVAA